MLMHPNIDPVALDLGFLQIHWYGLMYVAGFLCGYLVLRHFINTGRSNIPLDKAEDGIIYTALGLVIGARLGYFVFYNPAVLFFDPLRVLQLSGGGMSFHGGFIGVLIAVFLFSRYSKVRVGEISHIVALTAPIGIFFGRIGNFIGQELWGRPTDMPWGMVFQQDPLGLVRHPSQLYQAAGEGLAVFLILFWFTRKPRPEWSAGALFVASYGSIRFFIEFFREPDAHIGFDLFGWMTRGQLLSLPMVMTGIAVFIWAYKRSNPPLAGIVSNKNTEAGKAKNKNKNKKKK